MSQSVLKKPQRQGLSRVRHRRDLEAITRKGGGGVKSSVLSIILDTRINKGSKEKGVENGVERTCSRKDKKNTSTAVGLKNEAGNPATRNHPAKCQKGKGGGD